MVNKTALLTIGVVIIFLVLAVIGVLVLVVFPYDQVFAPTPTITDTPTITPTPTFPVFLPTARSDTPTKPAPSPTNTRVPTFTPAPTRTPPPTLVIVQPTVSAKTPTPAEDSQEPPAPQGTEEATTPEPAPTEGSRRYTLTFEADKPVLESGRCTTLRWQSSGPVALWYKGQAVESSGEERICPRDTTTYTIEFQVAGSAEVQTQSVTVKVE